MKFNSLTIENFMAISAAHVSLADRGLVLIQGDNQDETSAESNGAGKSSIGDALSWCLYGQTARGEDGDNVVNRKVGKNCKVAVDIIDGDYCFTITRHRKHKTGKNTLKVEQTDRGGTTLDLTKGTDKLTQVVVEQIIGSSYEVFTGAVYAGQERMPDLPGMTDKSLKLLIEEASGATVLEAAYKEAQARVSEKKQALVKLTDELANQARLLTVHKNSFDDAVTGDLAFEAERMANIEAKKRDGAARLINAKKIMEEINARPPKPTAQLEAADKAIAAVAGEIAKERELAGLLAKAESVYSVTCVAESHAEKAHKDQLAELSSLSHKLGCPCSTCARPFTAADIEPATKLATGRLVATQETWAETKNKRFAALKLTEDARSALNEFRSKMTDLTAVTKQREDYLRQIREIELLEQRYALDLREAEHCIAQKKKLESDKNPFAERIKAAEAEVRKVEATIAECRNAITEAEKGLVVQEVAAKVYSPAGVRAFLLDEVTPFLNSQTAKYLGTLADGNIQAIWTTLVKTAKGDWREKFSIEVTATTGGATFKSLSGGEKRKVRIACALALQDLVARRATKPIELFIGDEIDDALDTAGLERLTDILEEKARERGSVFVISHADLKDWIRNAITVRKKDGLSTIEEALV